MRRSNSKSSKKFLLIALFMLLVGGISFGYAKLKTTLSINGTAKIAKTSWNIHFDNVKVTTGSVGLSEGDIAAHIIDNTNKTRAEWTVTLNEPGDFYEFSIDVVNDGSLPGILKKITKDELPDVPENLKRIVKYTVTGEPALNSVLRPGAANKYTLTFRVEYDFDIEPVDLPSDPISITLGYELEYEQYRSNNN